MVSVDTTAFGPASILALGRACRSYVRIPVSVASVESFDESVVLDAIERLERQGVECIVLNAAQEAIAQHLPVRQAATPVVAIDDVPAAAVPVASFDQETGAATVARLLLEPGHRAIAHIPGPRDWLGAHRRIDGWRAAFKPAGVEPHSTLHGD